MSEVTAEMIARGGAADPEIAQKRRRQAVKLREARTRLTSDGWGGVANPFETELTRVFAENRRSAMPAQAVLILAVGAAACLWTQAWEVGLWVGLLFGSLGLSYAFAIRFIALEDESQIAGWRRLFALSEAFHGAAWGFLVVILMHADEPTVRPFVMLVMLAVAAVTTIVAATIPLAVYFGLAPLALALVLHFAPAGGADSLLLAALGVGAQLCFAVFGHRLYAAALEGLSFRKEKNALIAELEQAKANSDEARARAEDANLAKSRFLATMSHELRTPLNAILGFSEVMKNELFGAHVVPAYRDYSGDINSSGQHLLMLINEILDLSRVEAGRYELKEEAVNLAFIIEDCEHLLSMRAKKKSIAVTCAIEESLPRVWVDERAMRQIVLNLLSNAIKFTPQGGTVTVKLGWTAAGGQYVSIRDTGPGIPPDEIPVVMSTFGRGSMAQKQAEEGTGLGLPIVKGLVELHGGVFTLKSKVREGTEVIFILPSERVMNALPQMQAETTQRARRSVRRAA